MRAAADIAAEMDEGLQLLFQRGLELALQVQDDAMTAEAPEVRAKLALSFHRLSRSVRQTAALRMRLAREAERSLHDQEVRDAAAQQAVRRRRRAHLKGAIEALIWSEYEAQDEEAENLLERLDGVLAGLAETEDFLTQDPDVQIEALCRAIDYEPAHRLSRDSRVDASPGQPTPAPGGDLLPHAGSDGPWRSSA